MKQRQSVSQNETDQFNSEKIENEMTQQKETIMRLEKELDEQKQHSQQLEKEKNQLQSKCKQIEIEKRRKENEIKALKLQEERLLSTRRTESRRIKTGTTTHQSTNPYNPPQSKERMGVNDNSDDIIF